MRRVYVSAIWEKDISNTPLIQTRHYELIELYHTGQQLSLSMWANILRDREISR